MRISDWSSDVFSSDLLGFAVAAALGNVIGALAVVRHLRRGLRFIDACLAFGAGFMLAVTVLGVFHVVLKDSPGARSEGRSVGQECVITCRYRWSTTD